MHQSLLNRTIQFQSTNRFNSSKNYSTRANECEWKMKKSWPNKKLSNSCFGGECNIMVSVHHREHRDRFHITKGSGARPSNCSIIETTNNSDSNSNITISMLVMHTVQCTVWLKVGFLFRYYFDIIANSILGQSIDMRRKNSSIQMVEVWRKWIRFEIQNRRIQCLKVGFVNGLFACNVFITSTWDVCGTEPIKLKFKTTKSHWKALNLNHLYAIAKSENVSNCCRFFTFFTRYIYRKWRKGSMYVCFNGLEFCFDPFYDKTVNQTQPLALCLLCASPILIALVIICYRIIPIIII